MATYSHIAAMVLAAATAASSAIHPPNTEAWIDAEITLNYLGVPLNVVFMAGIGSLLSVLGNKVTSIQTLVYSFLTSSLFAIAVSVAIQEWSPWKWSSTGVQALFTAVLAATAQRWLPVLMDSVSPVVAAWIKRVTHTKEVPHDN